MCTTQRKTLTLMCLALVTMVSCCRFANASEMIELSDANQATLGATLSKCLRVVQGALDSNFEFESVEKASKFLIYCQVLKSKSQSSTDTDLEGLAGKIKALLNEPALSEACSYEKDDLESRFGVLDRDFSAENLDYLGESKFLELQKLFQTINSDPKLSVILGHLIKLKIDSLATALIENGSKDVSIMFNDRKPARGFFDFEVTLKNGCELEELKDICKVVRRTNGDNIPALGDDVLDFINLIEKNDEDQLETHYRKSGISKEALKAKCSHLLSRPYLKVPKQISKYLEAGFLKKETLESRFRADVHLHLYYEIYRLCMVV